MIYKFWKDNQTDLEFTLDLDQVKEKFLAWMKTKDKDWLEYYGYNPGLMQSFIGDSEEKKGLQSVSDDSTNTVLWEELKLTRVSYFESIDIN